MNHLWLMPEGPDKWKLLEEMFSLPPDQRLEWLKKHLVKGQIKPLGSTSKSMPEIAIELIKKGIKAKSIGFKHPKNKA